MLLSFTPVALSLAMVPATRASMTDLFHRECTMATRKGEPSSFEGGGAGPLMESDMVVAVCKAASALPRQFANVSPRQRSSSPCPGRLVLASEISGAFPISC